MFGEYENELQTLIKRVEVPVLGLLGGLLSTPLRDAIKKDLRESPCARSFAQRLDHYPAVFGVWLAEHVMQGVGQDGHFSLYPHVQRALGGAPCATADDRELLWRAFRRAIFKLGIQPLSRVSGAHFMADEYIRQAGVPIAFADDLALRMLQLARRLGVPDEDDQEGLLTWQSALLNKLGPPFSVTARKAVERDAQAYYTRTFLRVYANGGNPTGSDALEEALAKAFARDTISHSIRRAEIPQLLYRDGSLGILFPSASSALEYQLLIDGSSTSVHVDIEGDFRPLPAGLHKEVEVRRSDGERVLGIKLWPDEAANRLLVFNADGRLRGSGQLGQDDALELPPGRYVALCRFEPTGTDDWEEVSQRPRLVEVPLDVRPGAECLLVNGPAKVCILGQNQPSFELQGTVRGCLERLEFWYGDMLAQVEVPSEWRQQDSVAFELRVSVGVHQARIPLTLAGDGTATADLARAIEKLSIVAGLHRLVIELGRAGDARALQRQSVLYWKGLVGISYGLRFSYRHRPSNLISSSCAGVAFDDTQARPCDDQSRLVRMGFDIGGGRAVHLSWHRPGVFIEVEQPTADGGCKVVSRPLGATETVSLTSTKTIAVCSSEPGYLILGQTRLYVDFDRHPRKALAASFLASRLEPGERTLEFQTSSSGARTPLLLLSQPHVATRVTATRAAHILEVRVTVLGEPTDVSITGRDLSSGREHRVEHALLAGEWRTNDLARMQAYSAPMGAAHVISLLVDVQTLKPGIWTLVLGARIGGAWGHLEDDNEGRINIAIAIDALGTEVPGQQVITEAAGLSLAEVTARLARLNDHFRHCWSPVCWEQHSWLGLYYAALVELLRDHEGEFVAELADMAMARPADDVRQGFIAKQSVPASLNRLFALPRAQYRRVHIKAHPLSISLRAMSELTSSVSPAFGEAIHPCAAMAFKNFAEVSRGMRPKGFDLEKYRNALAQLALVDAYRVDDELFVPPRGELLSPIHLLHAWRDLERNYRTSQLLPSTRRAAALSLARILRRLQANLDPSAPAGLRGNALVLHPRPPTADDMDDGQQVELEQLSDVAHACAWLAWHCRLEVRRPGTLAEFHLRLSKLREQVPVAGPVVSDCLGYYLHVAPAMFSFYLLLWELALTVEFDPMVQNG